MKTHLLLPILSFLILANSLQAQKLTREEKKAYYKKGIELKKQFKEDFKNDPDKFLEFKEDIDSSSQKVNTLSNELVAYQSSLQDVEASLEALRRAKELDEQRIAQLKSKEKTKNNSSNPIQRIPQEGAFYAVQTNGQNPHIFSNDTPEISIAQNEKEVYVLGIYDTYLLAFELKKNIQAMGLQKAWIVAYKDGKMIDPDVIKDKGSNMMSKK